MQVLLRCLCPCLQKQTPAPVQTRPQVPKKRTRTVKPIPSRIRTKFNIGDFVIVDEQERRQNLSKAYCCPICTLYYTKILACSECINFVCFSCLQNYQTKVNSLKQKLKCPFCSSQKSFFCDYQLDPHSYFDATNKGFLSKQQRMRLDDQIVQKDSSNEKQQKEIKRQVQQQIICNS